MCLLHPAPALRAAAAALLWVVAASAASAPRAAAQTPRDDSDEMERVEVREVRIRGVKSVDLGELREALATQPSRCLGLIQKPFCLFTKSPYFFERHYLDREEFRRDVVRLLVFYYRRGWRNARVDTAVTQVARRAVRVDFEVSEGEPTRVDTVAVDMPRGAASPRRGRGRLRPRPGDPLNLLVLDSAVVRIRTNLWNRGYGDAAVDKPEIDVDTAAKRARVRIPVRPGPLTPIARVDVVHLRPDHQVSDETIRNSLSFEPGDLFRRAQIAQSQRALYESNLFRSAIIDTAVARDAATGRTVCAQQSALTPSAPPAAAAAAGRRDSTKSVVVCVLEGTLREARVSAGFSTVDFFQVEGRFTHNYFFGGARQLNLTAVVGNLGAEQLFRSFPFRGANGFDIGDEAQDALAQSGRYFAPTYSLGAEIRQRWFRSPRNTIAAGGFAHRRSSPAVFVDRGYGGNLTFTRTLAARAPASATYRFEVTRVEAGQVYFCVNFGVCDTPTVDALQGQQRLSPFALTLSSSTANDPLSPSTGYIGRFEAQHASAFTLSDFRFNRATAELAAYRQLGTQRGGTRARRSPVLAGRLRLGWVRALGSTNEAVAGGQAQGVAMGTILHPRTRFYAGGSQSVRGFGENQLGPRVLTISPSLLRGEEEKEENGQRVLTYTRCQPSTPIADCDVNESTLPDRDFVPRPLGGTSLLEGSVEIRIPVWGPLTVAGFVDGAVVGERSLGDFSNASRAITPGFGARYLSPVGPVRVDVGFRPKLVEDLQVVTEELMPDGSRRLVNLGARRYGDRAEKGLRGFLDRLTLHLSIGEAF
jgi:outer membrane protein assembly factor BamA